MDPEILMDVWQPPPPTRVGGNVSGSAGHVSQSGEPVIGADVNPGMEVGLTEIRATRNKAVPAWSVYLPDQRICLPERSVGDIAR